VQQSPRGGGGGYSDQFSQSRIISPVSPKDFTPLRHNRGFYRNPLFQNYVSGPAVHIRHSEVEEEKVLEGYF